MATKTKQDREIEALKAKLAAAEDALATASKANVTGAVVRASEKGCASLMGTVRTPRGVHFYVKEWAALAHSLPLICAAYKAAPNGGVEFNTDKGKPSWPKWLEDLAAEVEVDEFTDAKGRGSWRVKPE